MQRQFSACFFLPCTSLLSSLPAFGFSKRRVKSKEILWLARFKPLQDFKSLPVHNDEILSWCNENFHCISMCTMNGWYGVIIILSSENNNNFNVDVTINGEKKGKLQACKLRWMNNFFLFLFFV